MRRSRIILWTLLPLLLCVAGGALAADFTCDPPAHSTVAPGDTLRYTLLWTGEAEALRVSCMGQQVDANSIRISTDEANMQIVNGTDGFAALAASSCGRIRLTFDAVVSAETPVCVLQIGGQRYTIEHRLAQDKPGAVPGTAPVPPQPAQQSIQQQEDESMGQTSIWGYIGLGAVALGFAYGVWRQKTAPQRMAKRRAKQEAKQQALDAQLNAAEREE